MYEQLVGMEKLLCVVEEESLVSQVWWWTGKREGRMESGKASGSILCWLTTIIFMLERSMQLSL